MYVFIFYGIENMRGFDVWMNILPWVTGFAGVAVRGASEWLCAPRRFAE